MNNTNQSTANMTTSVPPATQLSNQEADLAGLQDVEKKIYQPTQLEEGVKYIQEVMTVCEKAQVEPILNFKIDDPFPEDYCLAVIPQQQRVPSRGNQTINIIIAAIPTTDNLLTDDNGINYINKLITDSLIRQVVVSAKPRDEGALIMIPFKMAEFVTTSRDNGLASFNAIASSFVKALKTKGMMFITKVLLRQVLASASLAEQQFPKLPQTSWQHVIKTMIVFAKQKGLNAGILQHWLDTRDTVLVDVTEIDLSDLDEIVETAA